MGFGNEDFFGAKFFPCARNQFLLGSEERQLTADEVEAGNETKRSLSRNLRLTRDELHASYVSQKLIISSFGCRSLSRNGFRSLSTFPTQFSATTIWSSLLTTKKPNFLQHIDKFSQQLTQLWHGELLEVV